MADCEDQRLTICVTGTKGSGKSILIKSLLEGQAIISMGDGINDAPLAIASGRYEGEFLGIPASFYNIRAPSNIVSNKLLVKNVEALNLFDTSTLVLFCVKMSNRPRNDEIEEEIEISIKWLNKHLGQEQTLHILRKTIFVLTFADAEGFTALPGSSRSVATNVTILMTKCMTKRMMECSFCFEDCLKKQDIPNEIINKMPVCAAGKGSEVKLPLTNNWVKTLWECCMVIAQREIETDLSRQTIGHFINCDAKKSLEKGMQEGYVSLNYIKMVICGPPCVGKTAFKDLLANRPPPLKHHSTSIAARPVEGVTRIAAGGRVWKEVTEGDLLEMLSDTIRYDSIHHQPSETLEIDSSIANEAEAEYSSTKQEDVPSLFQSDSSSTPSLSLQETIDSPTEDIDFASKKIIEQLSVLRNTASPIKLHEESSWIHLLDSGGQPQFTDLLRMFVRGNSLYIIVMKVTESLHDKPTFVYSINGKALNTPKEMTMTNLQIIERFVRSVAATSKEDKSEPAFAIIATHCDKSKFKRFFGFEETIKEKNETLLSCLNEFLHLFIFYNRDSNELIFPVNNLCKWNREKISADICHRLLSDIRGNIKIPVRWYVFDLNMKNEALKEAHGMISLESCYSIGQRLGMDQEEVNECLIYLDSMRLCIYYHKLLPHVIFTNPQFLIDCLSNIACVSFVNNLTEIGINLSHKDLKSLKTDGVLEKSLLDSLQLDLVHGLFSKEDLLSLLQHFLIISVIKTADESPQYFIPILLPAENLNEEQKALFAQVADPIFIQFNKMVLQGLFPTLVVSLLSREEEPLFFIDSRTSEFPQQLRHAVKLYSEELFGSVFLCENNESIEVYFTGRSQHCYRLRKVVLEALSISAKVLQYDEKKLNMSAVVRCNRKHSVPANDKKVHPITISYKNDPPEIGCSVETSLPTITINDLSEKQSCWLIGTAGTYPETISLPTDGNEVLNHTHAPIVLDAIKSVVFQWMVLGINLGIEKYKLEEIKYNSRDQVQVCRKDMIHHWIDTRRATCNALIKALEIIEENRIVCNIKQLQTA